jgi:hypothetical protein
MGLEKIEQQAQKHLPQQSMFGTSSPSSGLNFVSLEIIGYNTLTLVLNEQT